MTQSLRQQELAQHWVASCLQQGAHAIDATAGNGHDSLFLAQCVGNRGRVDAFDIQTQALDATKKRLAEAGLSECLHCHPVSHCRMAEFIPTPVQAIMFNLGYLPGGDHTLTTKTTESLLAIQAALKLLDQGGILCIMCYPGHEEGKRESESVEQLISSLPQSHWRAMSARSINAPSHAPFTLAALKLKAAP